MQQPCSSCSNARLKAKQEQPQPKLPWGHLDKASLAKWMLWNGRPEDNFSPGPWHRWLSLEMRVRKRRGVRVLGRGWSCGKEGEGNQCSHILEVVLLARTARHMERETRYSWSIWFG